MKLSELTELLGLAAAYEHRPEPVEADVKAWHLVVGYYDADLARECLLEHYAEEVRRLWPADLVARADAKIANDPTWQRVWWQRHPPDHREQQLAPAVIDAIMGRDRGWSAPDGELPRGR